VCVCHLNNVCICVVVLVSILSSLFFVSHSIICFLLYFTSERRVERREKLKRRRMARSEGILGAVQN
jgi:hypothetical protein